MEQAEYLDRCKAVLGVTSDFRLAELLDIPRMRVSDYRLDKIKFDEYACFKIAEVLEESPTKIIARVLATKAKSPAKSLFFQQFFMIAGLWITLGVMLPFLGSTYGSAYADGITKINHINQHNRPLYEVADTIKNKIKRFFSQVLYSHLRHFCRILYV